MDHNPSVPPAARDYDPAQAFQKVFEVGNLFFYELLATGFILCPYLSLRLSEIPNKFGTPQHCCLYPLLSITSPSPTSNRPPITPLG